MLVKKGEANKMYRPFKFLKPASKELGQINPEWMCQGSDCMAWQRIVGSRWAGRTWLLWVSGKTAFILAQNLGLSIMGLSRSGHNLLRKGRCF